MFLSCCGGFRDGYGLAAAKAWGAQGIAMGTRFMMTQESPVPENTKDAYLQAGIDEISVTKKFDGLPHRLIFNKYIQNIDKSNPLKLFFISLKSAWKYKQISQASFGDIVKSFLQCYEEMIYLSHKQSWQPIAQQ